MIADARSCVSVVLGCWGGGWALVQREVITTLLCTTWAIQRGFRGCAMDEIWKAAPTTKEYGRCYVNKQRNHTKETGGKTAIFVFEKRKVRQEGR